MEITDSRTLSVVRPYVARMVRENVSELVFYPDSFGVLYSHDGVIAGGISRRKYPFVLDAFRKFGEVDVLEDGSYYGGFSVVSQDKGNYIFRVSVRNVNCCVMAWEELRVRMGELLDIGVREDDLVTEE